MTKSVFDLWRIFSVETTSPYFGRIKLKHHILNVEAVAEEVPGHVINELFRWSDTGPNPRPLVTLKQLYGKEPIPK